jgi:hypothetical protein
LELFLFEIWFKSCQVYFVLPKYVLDVLSFGWEAELWLAGHPVAHAQYGRLVDLLRFEQKLRGLVFFQQPSLNDIREYITELNLLRIMLIHINNK